MPHVYTLLLFAAQSAERMAPGDIAEPTVSAWWLGVAAVASALLTKGGDTLSKSLKERSERHREERADAVSEWREISASLQARVNILTEQVNKLQSEHISCREENAALRTEIKILRADVERLKGGAA